MTRDERIQQLRDDNERSRERIRQREEERERDPIKMFEHIMSDARISKDARSGLHYTEPVQTPPVEKADLARGMVFRRQENARATAPQPGAMPSDAEDWRDEVAQAMGECLVVTRRELRHEM